MRDIPPELLEEAFRRLADFHAVQTPSMEGLPENPTLQDLRDLVDRSPSPNIRALRHSVGVGDEAASVFYTEMEKLRPEPGVLSAEDSEDLHALYGLIVGLTARVLLDDRERGA